MVIFKKTQQTTFVQNGSCMTSSTNKSNNYCRIMFLNNFICFICILFSSITSQAEGANILLLPLPASSHLAYFKAVGDALHEHYNDNLYLVLTPTYPGYEDIVTSSSWKHYEVITHHVRDKDFYQDRETKTSEEDGQEFIDVIAVGPVADFRNSLSFYSFCTNLLSDKVVMDKLVSLKIDLVIIDGHPFSHCFYVIPYKLGIPYVSIATVYEPWLHGNPSLPSFVPFSLALFNTEKMSFLERLESMWAMIDWYVWPRFIFREDHLVHKYALEKPFKSIWTLASGNKLWLLNLDLVIDYPKPLIPHVHYVGGLTTKPGKQLDENFAKLVENSKGVILFSFGTLANSLPKSVIQKFSDSFHLVPEYTVIMKYNGVPPDNPPKNLIIKSWLPQNDLLANNKTKLFITHCGSNGQFEAVYHAVPMMGFFIFMDQGYNCARMEYKKFGKCLDIRIIISETFAKSMVEVIQNTAYKDSISKASDGIIFKKRPKHPKYRAASLIHQVLERNTTLLRSAAVDMPWYKFMMLDIILFFTVVTVLPLWCIRYFCC